MKVFAHLFILLIALTFINSQHGDECYNIKPSSADDCKDSVLTDNDKKKAITHCCYYEYKDISENNKGCKPITTNQYKNFKKYYNLYMEDNEYYYDISIDCNSSSLKLSLLGLLLFFL